MKISHIICKDCSQASDALTIFFFCSFEKNLIYFSLLSQNLHHFLPHQVNFCDLQNITFLSKIDNCCVPSWEDIQNDILKEGKGGLCLSLNVAFAAVVRVFGVHAHLVPADYVATNGTSVHVLTIFHLCRATSQSACKCFEVETKTLVQRKRPSTDPCRRSPRLKPRNTIASTSAWTPMPPNAAQYCLQRMKVKCNEHLHKHSLYIADVGCGFPTLRSINLSEDIDKPFIDCGLEYCFRKKHHKYFRLHRAGDEVPEGEEVKNMYMSIFSCMSV